RRRRGLAAATIKRRLITLGALMKRAREDGMISWQLDVPGDGRLSRMAMVGGHAAPYLFPEHPGETDRLDVQHHALRLAVGTNYLVPVGRPGRVLDCGGGTGQWAFELCTEFPDALVVGVDLQPAKPDRPVNFRFVQASVLGGLPFADGGFDYVHQRLLAAAIPLSRWSELIGELVRVVRPGGWVELVEADWAVEPGGPATRELIGLAMRLGRSLGLDTMGTIFRSLDGHLARAGLVDVARRTIELPL